MRATAIASLAALCIAGAALAQEAPMVFQPAFEAQPSPAELVRHYPPEALHQGVSGITVLCCAPRADRSVACDVSSEWPEGRGFGAAAVAASSGYRLSPQSQADLDARPGTLVRISMMWAAPMIPQHTINELQRIDGETFEACLPPLDVAP